MTKEVALTPFNLAHPVFMLSSGECVCTAQVLQNLFGLLVYCIQDIQPRH